MVEPEEKNIIETIITPEYDTVVIGRSVIKNIKLENYEYEEALDRSLMEMSTIYGEIYYQLKRFIELAYMPFLEATSDYEQLSDFLTMMDDAYGV